MPDDPLILPFKKFAKGDYDEGDRNLYIVWRGKKCLYVGISKYDIWVRWFHRNHSHIEVEADTIWHGHSPIGQAITRNLPSSYRWKIELRYVPEDLEAEERKLIRQLRPLFNIVYRNKLSPAENRLSRTLLGDTIG